MNDCEYPFEAEWAERQSEPDESQAGIHHAPPSPLAFDRIPDREQKQLFDRKENE